MAYKKQDRFHQRAKKEQFAARSVYKLAEIDQRFSLIERGARLVDLGASPGSWMQYLSKAVGKKGAVVGYDLTEPDVVPGPNARHTVADVDALTASQLRRDVAEILAARKGTAPEDQLPPTFRIDGLLSDMAPKLTGIRDADQAKSVALAARALALADEVVKVDGFFVAKLFQGRDTDGLLDDTKRVFRDVRLLKPEATRDGSREVFVVARRKKALAPRLMD